MNLIDFKVKHTYKYYYDNCYKVLTENNLFLLSFSEVIDVHNGHNYYCT